MCTGPSPLLAACSFSIPPVASSTPCHFLMQVAIHESRLRAWHRADSSVLAQLVCGYFPKSFLSHFAGGVVWSMAAQDSMRSFPEGVGTVSGGCSILGKNCGCDCYASSFYLNFVAEVAKRLSVASPGHTQLTRSFQCARHAARRHGCVPGHRSQGLGAHHG